MVERVYARGGRNTDSLRPTRLLYLSKTALTSVATLKMRGWAR